jgi:hypothetical protein
MRKMTNLFLATAALSLASLGVASPALAATPHNSAQVASHGQSAGSPVRGHHQCPPWQFPYCDKPTYNEDTTAPNYNLLNILGGRCRNMGFKAMEVLKNENYTGPNGRPWQRGAYRCYN